MTPKVNRRGFSSRNRLHWTVLTKAGGNSIKAASIIMKAQSEILQKAIRLAQNGNPIILAQQECLRAALEMASALEAFGARYKKYFTSCKVSINSYNQGYMVYFDRDVDYQEAKRGGKEVAAVLYGTRNPVIHPCSFFEDYMRSEEGASIDYALPFDGIFEPLHHFRVHNAAEIIEAANHIIDLCQKQINDRI